MAPRGAARMGRPPNPPSSIYRGVIIMPRTTSLPRREFFLWIGLCAVSVAGALSKTAAAQEELKTRGEVIYAEKCAACHGPMGQGTEDNKKALAGDLSVSQLADVIAETMPEDDPGSLSTDDSRQVAAYVYDAFYSAVARARNQPARIELARLTVHQYRQAVADLIGGFRGPMHWGDERGLRGEYYEGRRIGVRRGRGRAAVRRVDENVDFDFGADPPVEEIDDEHWFSIRWSGAVLAPETGEYEFVVRTDHAARLWVNDMENPLIDAWVKSGDDSEFRASLYLVGGRVYPIRLDFSKATQGVNNQEKKDDMPPTPASIALLWQRPHAVVETLAARHLSPEASTEQYICSTPFPPDDRSYGWERGTTVSKAWDEATTAAAIDVARYVANHINTLAGAEDEAADRAEKLRALCGEFVARAFRRQVNEELQHNYVDRQFDAVDDPAAAVRRVVLLTLKSPRFLYREVGDAPAAYDVAARLSFGLWDSLPDGPLREAAQADQLNTDKQVRAAAERMLDDPRARLKLRQFLLTWLHVDEARDLGKDPEYFPGFDSAEIADLRTSLELFLDEVVWSEASNFRQLLMAEDILLNQRLADFYGADVNVGHHYAPVRLNDEPRAGVLTHPYIMARFAHNDETSPIHRGVFLARGVLGQSLRPPPVAVAPLAPDLHPELTTRERVMLQTKEATCMACHRIINPLGFTLERFDAVGRYRELDRERPIDDTGSYQTRDGATVELTGARQLAEFLADSEECHTAFTEQLFHHLVQQSVRAYGETTLDDLRRTFVQQEFNIRKLAVEAMVASAGVGRPTEIASLPDDAAPARLGSSEKRDDEVITEDVAERNGKKIEDRR